MSVALNAPVRPSSAARLCAALGAVMLGLLTTLLMAGPAQADDVTWAVRTASNTFGSDRQNFNYSLNPGGDLKDSIVVSNHGEAALDLKLYAADGYTNEQGQLDLNNTEQKSTAVGAWVHFDQSDLHLEPGQTLDVPFTVKVPDNATPGDHLGGVVTSLKQEGEEQGINVDRRLALKVLLRVGGDLKPSLAVEDVKLDYSPSWNPFSKGDATITYTLHNTGNAILSANQEASIAGPFGVLRAKADKLEASPELLPGESWKVRVKVDGVSPTLLASAKVTVIPVMTDISGTVNQLKTVDASAHALAFSWSWLVLVVVVAGAVVGWLRLRDRRKRSEEERIQQAVSEALREKESSSAE